MRLSFFPAVSLILATSCQAENPAAKSTSFQDNILKKFLESAVNDEHDQFAVIKDRKTGPPRKLDQRKRTVVLTSIGNASQEDAGPSKQKTRKVRKYAGAQKDVGGSTSSPNTAGGKPSADEDQFKPDIQPELTFETPASAPFLLKSLDTRKREVSFSEHEVKEIEGVLKSLESVSKELETVKTRFISALGKLHQPEKTEKEEKQATDLLNYNFIEVTETPKKDS